MSEQMTAQITPWEQVTIANGLMFRLVMNKPEMCRKLLERLLDIKIKTIEVPDFEKDFRVNGTSKGIRLDIYIEDVNGSAVVVEMQTMTLSQEMIGKRTRYYQSITDMNLLKKGEVYTNLKKSFIIFICTFDPYKQGRSKYTFSHLCHEDKNLSMGDETTAIFFNVQGSMKGITKAQRSFLEYVKDGCISDDFTRELDENVKKQHLDDGKRVMYMTWEQEIMLAQEIARKEEREKVREEERKRTEEKIRIVEKQAAEAEKQATEAKEQSIKSVKVMLAKKMSYELISEISGFTIAQIRAIDLERVG